MEGTVAGVRIVPPVVEFFDAEVDVLHQMSLTVQNLSKTLKSIRFHGPSTNVCIHIYCEEYNLSYLSYTVDRKKLVKVMQIYGNVSARFGHEKLWTTECLSYILLQVAILFQCC